MRPHPAAAAALLALLALPSGAAVVVLKDGGRREGTVVGATVQELILHTPEGTLRIPTERISRVDYAESETPPAAAPAAPPEDRRTLEERLGWPEGRSELSLNLGLGATLSDVGFGSIGGGTASNGDVGPLLGLQYLRELTPQLAVGGEFGFLHRSATDDTGLLQSANSNVWGDTLSLLAVLRASLTDHGVARPYVLVGAGAARSTLKIDATPLAGFQWADTATDETRRLVDGEKWLPAGAARIGVEFNAFAPTRFSLEAGWLGVGSGRFSAAPAGQAIGLTDVAAPVNAFTFSARWAWRF